MPILFEVELIKRSVYAVECVQIWSLVMRWVYRAVDLD
jgi:hypothetical protein